MCNKITFEIKKKKISVLISNSIREVFVLKIGIRQNRMLNVGQ